MQHILKVAPGRFSAKDYSTNMAGSFSARVIAAIGSGEPPRDCCTHRRGTSLDNINSHHKRNVDLVAEACDFLLSETWTPHSYYC